MPYIFLLAVVCFCGVVILMIVKINRACDAIESMNRTLQMIAYDLKRLSGQDRDEHKRAELE